MSPARVPAIYTRVSTDIQAAKDVGSLETQELSMRRYLQYADEHGPEPRVFREEGVSGKNLDRPALQSLMRAVEAGEISMVLVTRIDRLTRSLPDFFALHAVLERCGVTLVSKAENFDTTSALGRAMLQLLLVFAQLEREQTAERTRAAMRARAEAGLSVGGAPTLGYDTGGDGQFIPNEEEARVVRLAFEKYLQWRSSVKVAQWLNEQGFRQKRYRSRRRGPSGGGTFKPDTVRRMIRNVRYIGQIRLDGEPRPGIHDGIVPKEVFHAANEAMDRNKKPGRSSRDRAKHDYLLSGLVKGTEGYAMTTSSAKGRGGKRYFYYRNTGAEKEPDFPFELKQVSASKLEDKVLGLVRDLARQPETVNAAVEEANRVLLGQLDPLRGRVKALQTEAARAQEEASRMTRRALLLDLADASMVKQELAMAGARAKNATAALATAEAELQAKEGTHIDTLVVREALRGFDDAWDNLNADERRDLLRMLIQKVVVRPGKAEVHFYGCDAVRVGLQTGRRTKKNETPPGKPEGFVRGSIWRRQQDSNL